jgi:dTDP-glucose 4,6-dehydratase
MITGGAGFIGANLVRYVLERRPDVRVVTLDALTYAGSRANLRELSDPDRHTFVHGSICDRVLIEDALDRHQVDTIIHLAAESHVDRSIEAPATFVETNIVGTFHLLEAARRRNLRFHHVSTDEVFGALGPNDPPFCEETPYDPRSPYSASKAASDHLVRSYFHTYTLPVTLSNCSNNYGPYQFPEKLIPVIITHALRGDRLPIYGDGRQIRDWLYVEDHCEAILSVVENGQLGQTYTVGGDNQPTNIELVERICRLLDELAPQSPHRPHAQLIQFVTDRRGHDRRYAIAIDKIRGELGWAPRTRLSDGLRATVAWYLANHGWLEDVHSRPGYRAWIARNYTERDSLP